MIIYVLDIGFENSREATFTSHYTTLERLVKAIKDMQETLSAKEAFVAKGIKFDKTDLDVEDIKHRLEEDTVHIILGARRKPKVWYNINTIEVKE